MTTATDSLPTPPEDVAVDPAARAALYSLLARAFEHPDEEFHAAASEGALNGEISQYLSETTLGIAAPNLTVEESDEALSARYNGLFTVGHARYTDRTDGSLDSEGPPVPLYESSYREASWNDVNRDLARAYDYFGLAVDEDEREHHDYLPLLLEFAAYLSRREALGEEDAARARRDVLDRHLDPFTEALVERLTEVEREFYTALATLTRRVVLADMTAIGGDDDG